MAKAIIDLFGIHPWIPTLLGMWAIWCILILIYHRMPPRAK